LFRHSLFDVFQVFISVCSVLWSFCGSAPCQTVSPCTAQHIGAIHSRHQWWCERPRNTYVATNIL